MNIDREEEPPRQPFAAARMQAAKQDGSAFVPTLNGGSFASTRVPVVPSLNARAIGDLVKNWNLNALAPSGVNAGSATAMNNAKRQKAMVAARGNNNNEGCTRW